MKRKKNIKVIQDKIKTKKNKEMFPSVTIAKKGNPFNTKRIFNI